jgi:hypothetical protein
MEPRTDNIEHILNGHLTHLSNDDIAVILAELVNTIKNQEKRIKELESELYSVGGVADPEYTSSVIDGSKIWHVKGEL